MASKSARTLSFFFTLFGALEFAGKEIIHHQRRNESRDAKILLRIVIEDMEPKLIATVNEPCEELVNPKFFFVRPLADRVQQPPPTPAQLRASADSSRV